MIAITSISPKHVNGDIQQIAIQSWIDLGMTVYSMNGKTECDMLRPEYPNVTFIETDRTMEKIYGKEYVSIDAIFEWCCEQESDNFCLINSDIELATDRETIERISNRMKDAIIVANRISYTDAYTDTKIHDRGLDVFFLNKRFIEMFPKSMYAMGLCHWDLRIPYLALKNDVPIIFLKRFGVFHKKHKVQYNKKSWEKTGRYFMWENDLFQFDYQIGVFDMSSYVFDYIYKNITRELI